MTNTQMIHDRATQSPVAAAVMPLMQSAQHRAAHEARAYINRLMDELEAAGMDAQAFPYPSGSDRDYFNKLNRHKHVQQFTESAVKGCRHHRAPDPRVPSADGQQRFVSQAVEAAKEQYLAFVAKLESKAGEVVSATLEGEHVWGYSTLTVTKS